MSQVAIADAASRLQQLIEQARRGETIELTENGHPVARLVPVMRGAAPQEGNRPFGSAKGLIEIADDFDAPLDDFADYR